MTHAPSQTAGRSGLLLPLGIAAAAVAGLFVLVGFPEHRRPPPVADATPPGEPLETDHDFRPEPPPPQPPPEIARAEVDPREIGWLRELPRASTFGSSSFAAGVARDDEELALQWTMFDRGPALDANGGLVGEEHRDRRYALDVSWRGETRTVTLEPSYGWPDATLTSYCDRRGWRYIQQGIPLEAAYPYAPAGAHLPELAVFAEGNFRGDEVYRVLATPHAIQIIAQDTSPGDWIHECHEVRQGPFTECREMSWSLLATIAVDLPSAVHVTESVKLTDDDGTDSLACDAVSEMYEVLEVLPP